MNATKRRMELFALLQAEGSVSVNALVERFGVSAMTIRRDFALFEQQGIISTNYGGATLRQGVGTEPSFSLKRGQMRDAKRQIAQQAASYVQSGDTVLLDCGSTTLEILNYLGRKKITLITGSWPVISALHGNPHVALYLAPGRYDTVSAGVMDAMTIAFFRQLNADIVFMGTQGLCPHHGATVPDPMDASVKETLLRQGKRKVLLADSSKLGQSFLSRYALPKQFDTIITNQDGPQGVIQSLEQQCSVIDLV